MSDLQPIFIAPLAAAWGLGVVLLALDGTRRPARYLALAGMIVVLALDVAVFLRIQHAGPMTVTTGGWPVGVGITLRADGVSAYFATVSTVVCLVVLAHGLPRGARDRRFFAWLFFLAAALHGLFFTYDLFNFYVFFELAIMTSFVLALHGYGRAQIRGGATYVVVSLLGSFEFLFGVALAYRTFGTLEIGALTAHAPAASPSAVLLVAALLFSALALKLGLFPFHWWVPAIYVEARPAVAAALAGAVANVGAYGLLRFGTTFLEPARDGAGPALVVLGAAGALYGSLVAAGRRSPAEASAYASVAHGGYILVAIGLGSAGGWTAALLLVLSGALDKTLVFCALEVPRRAKRGLVLLAACSIAGLPVTIGFVAKLVLVHASLRAPAAPVLVFALLSSAALGLFFSARLWFSTTARRTHPVVPAWASLLLGVLVVGLGLWPEPLLAWTEQVGQSLARGGP